MSRVQRASLQDGEEIMKTGPRPVSVFHLCADETPENCGQDEVSSAQHSERDPGEEG